MSERFFTVQHVAEIVHRKDKTVRRWILEGKLKARRGIGGYLVERRDLSDFIKRLFPFVSMPTNGAKS